MSEAVVIEDAGATPVAGQNSEPITTPAAEKPSWLPEQYESPEKFREAWDNQRSLIGKRVTDLTPAQRKALYEAMPEDIASAREKDLREALSADEEFAKSILEKYGPKAPETYEIAPDIIPEGVELAAEHPARQEFDALAKELGLSNDAYNKLMAIGIKLSLPPDPGSLEERVKEMGDGFVDRAKATRTQMMNAVPAEHHEALHSLWGKIMTPAEYKAFEALVKGRVKEAPLPRTEAASEPMLTAKEIESMQRDPRYWDASRADEGFRAKVRRGIERLHGVIA